MSYTPALRPAALGTIFAALAVAGGAQAHAHLVTSSPAAKATGPSPAEIRLTMSEAPMAKFSGVTLMTEAGASVAVRSVKVVDRDTMAVAPIAPLKPGLYSVRWHAVASDMHRSQGAFSFTVR